MNKIEYKVALGYPGRITENQLHSLENLRGIPNGTGVHPNIKSRWNGFYDTHPPATTTLQDVLDFVKEIDDIFRDQFIPPVR